MIEDAATEEEELSPDELVAICAAFELMTEGTATGKYRAVPSFFNPQSVTAEWVAEDLVAAARRAVETAVNAARESGMDPLEIEGEVGQLFRDGRMYLQELTLSPIVARDKLLRTPTGNTRVHTAVEFFTKVYKYERPDLYPPVKPPDAGKDE
jgi:hypothetical protein